MWTPDIRQLKIPGDILVLSLLFVTGLSIPVSTSLNDLLFPVLLIVFIFEWKKLPIKQQITRIEVWLPVLLFGWFALSLFWTIAPLGEALLYLKKYRVLLYFVFLVPLLHTSKRRTMVWAGFLAGCSLTIAAMVWALWFPVSITKLTGMLGIHDPVYAKGALFKNHITTGILIAIASFIWLTRFRYSQHPYRWCWLLMGALATYMNLFHSYGRTGYVLTFVLLALFLFHVYKWKSLVAMVILAPIMAIGVYHFSAHFKHRIDDAVYNVQTYHDNHLTPVGVRMSFFMDSLQMVRKRPVTGYGIGSTHTYFEEHFQQKYEWIPSNPHGEYVLQASQGGILALLLFVTLLILHFFTKSIPNREREYHQGAILAIAVGCLANSLFLDHSESHFYVLMVSTGIAASMSPRIFCPSSATDISNTNA